MYGMCGDKQNRALENIKSQSVAVNALSNNLHSLNTAVT